MQVEDTETTDQATFIHDMISGLGDNLLPWFDDYNKKKAEIQPPSLVKLFSDAKFLDEGSVTFKVCLLKIIEQTTSLTDHLVHTAS